MYASVIIPVWQGESVILDCLQALYAHSDSTLHEVICIDNGSTDQSAALIAQHYPQVTLLRQPVNLGFSGGVNVGLAAASGDVLILLNQDCLVNENWLPPLLAAFAAHAEYGIFGATIFDSDGTINHTGAFINRPDGYGQHETAVSTTQPPTTPRPVEYVNGALFALRRVVWDTIGPFDESFYPAYYEESDYCYRARQHGFQIGHLAATQATHHFSSRDWQKEPLRHWADQHLARYHFVSKHFEQAELLPFFEAEAAAIQNEAYQDQLLGRALAARDLLRDLPAILNGRFCHLDQPVTAVRHRLLQVHFTRLRQQALRAAQQLPGFEQQLTHCQQQLDEMQAQIYDLLARIYFRHPQDTQPESSLHRLWRLLVLRPFSFLCLRDYLLQAQLNTLHAARADLLQQSQQINWQASNYRLTLLTSLQEYEYR
jgi:GT2 family glycosyltransferase